MDASPDIERIADSMGRAVEGLRSYRALVRKILGNSPEEVRETLKAMEGLTPAQIRDALEAYKGLHPDELREGD